MRVFKKPNTAFGWKCPVCSTDAEKEVVLVSIVGTSKDNICEGEQFHLDCLEPWFYKDKGLLVQQLGKTDD